MATTTVSFAGFGILSQGVGDVWYSAPAGAPITTAAGGGSSAQTGSGQAAFAPASATAAPSGGGGYGGGGGGMAPAGGGGYSGPVGSGGPLPVSPVGDSPTAGPISRAEVLARARFWVSQAVPYSMSGYTNDPNGKIYRTDCSGMVSMALHLDESLSTTTLQSVLYPIPKEDLKPADILGNLGAGTGGSAGHVLIFNGWVDDSMTTFRSLEETPPCAVEKNQTFGATRYTQQAWRYHHLLDP